MSGQQQQWGGEPKQQPGSDAESTSSPIPAPLVFYDAGSVLSVPVTPQQVMAFNPREQSRTVHIMPDGSEYYGDFLLDRPHGIGIMLFKSTSATYGSGDRYGGAWHNGLFHGEGVLITSGFTYQGGFYEGKMHGHGRMTYSRRVSDMVLRGISVFSPFEQTNAPLEYTGDFHHTHHRHGRGMARYVNGDVYDGDWISNRRQGQGKLVTESGEVYEGQWDRDERHGYGKISYADGGQFKGMMVHNKRHGEGVMLFSNGDEYYGTFTNDTIRGQGTMRYKNGDVYEGMWKDGLRNGEGKYTLRKQGAIVEGCFVHGLIQGRGVVQHPGVSTFVGEFDRGERKEGTIFWHDSFPDDKSCYQGEWLGEKMHGHGLLWYRNGDFFFGRFVKNKRQGPGNIRYADGTEYSGYFNNDVREGEGILQGTNGSIQAGLWCGDAFIEGYDGEWGNKTFNGIGHLQLREPSTVGISGINNSSSGNSSPRMGNTKDSSSVIASAAAAVAAGTPPIIEYFGLFQNGVRQGPGILRLAGHTIMGDWNNDVLDCEAGSWEFPSGDLYMGSFKNGNRDGNVGRIWFADGSFFIGRWKLDAPLGEGVFHATDPKDPIYAPEESEVNTGDTATSSSSNNNNTKNVKGNEETNKNSSNSGGGNSFGMMNMFMNLFRRKLSEEEEDKREIIGFHDHYVLIGEWELARLPYTLYQSIMSRVSSSVSNTNLSKPPLSISVGMQERHGVVVFKSGVVVRTEWLQNHPRLMLPHRWDAPLHQKIYPIQNGDNRNNTNPGVTTGQKACTFCDKVYTFFRKETTCTLCERSSCSSCLHPIDVRGHPQIEALVRLRMGSPTGGIGGTSSSSSPGSGGNENMSSGSGGGTVVADISALPSQVPACFDCGRAALLGLEFNTIWLPMRYCQGFAKSEEDENSREGGEKKESATAVTTTTTATATVTSGLSITTPLTPESYDREQRLLKSITSFIPMEEDYKEVEREEYIVYEGYTCRSVPHIYGSLWWGKRHYYCGDFQEGRRHGRGVQIFPNGEQYVGQFIDDVWDGPGVYCADDGTVYEGLWREGRLATLRYRGEVDAQQRPHGCGESYSADGGRYNGEWSHGVWHGTGIEQRGNGVVYRGEFVSGEREGRGKLVGLASVFDGEFVAGRREGRGMERFGECMVVGEWRRDVLVGAVRVYDGITQTVYDTTFADNSDSNNTNKNKSNNDNNGVAGGDDNMCGGERDDCFAPPVMVDDMHSPTCALCHVSFSLFLRRHHCRLCGFVVCDACSQRRVTLPAHFKLEGPQRVCDACSQRLKQRRMLGVKRYLNGEVYAGCWSQGQWVSRGLFRRRDGSMIVMDIAGRPLQGNKETTTTTTTTTTNTTTDNKTETSKPSGDSVLDAAPAVEELRLLPASPNAAVDAFSLWWGMMLTVANLHVPLDLTPLTEFVLPRPEEMKPLKLFSTVSSAHDNSAAVRAVKYTPAIAPRPPPCPVPQPPSSSSTSTSLSSQTKQEGLSEQHELFMIPPRPIICDSILEQRVKNSRMEIFPAVPPTSYNNSSSSSDTNNVVMLSCYTQETLLPPTPQPPPVNTNEHVPWDDWNVRPVPKIRNATAGTGTTAEWHQMPFACLFMRPDVNDVDRVVRGETARWSPTPMKGPQVFTVTDTLAEGVIVEQNDVNPSSPM
ncbi:uncharacterized protein TM35_000211380 [Trypanosoma theileri]|uniref:FYVE-type domain-containing protein n=1 Tax=Trypanosoma theileri TaxID=67003 RepID=A0A1X0NS48_9TRYP|nr:uncharacterized protein TM35_000211380 [Trypanosoma theileri]ORC87532.1 hypothetical protein TM35_000211380 [Trypanosoma theileri]